MFDLEKELDGLRNIADRFDMHKYFSIEDRLREKININSPQVWITDKLKFCDSVRDRDLKCVIVRVIIGTLFDLYENFENFKESDEMIRVLSNIKFTNSVLVKIEELKVDGLEFPEDKKQMLKNHKIKLENN